MLQLLLPLAFSAVPLTLYVPPIRSLNLFVETLEGVVHHTAAFTLRTYPRIRLALSRVIRSLFRLFW
ncbi:hypothetical protein SLA2020_370940 [Shorea laevis]